MTLILSLGGKDAAQLPEGEDFLCDGYKICWSHRISLVDDLQLSPSPLDRRRFWGRVMASICAACHLLQLLNRNGALSPWAVLTKLCGDLSVDRRPGGAKQNKQTKQTVSKLYIILH